MRCGCTEKREFNLNKSLERKARFTLGALMLFKTRNIALGFKAGERSI